MKSYTFDLLGNKAHLKTNSIIFLYAMWNGYSKGHLSDDVLAKNVHQTLFEEYGDSIKVWSRRGHFLSNCGYLVEPGSHKEGSYTFTNKFRELFKLYYQNLEEIVLEYDKETKKLQTV